MNLSVYLIGAAFLLGSAVGYGYRDDRAESERVEAVEKALEQAYLDAELARDEELALIKAQQKTEVVYRTITKEVPKYVTQIQRIDSQCNLSRGTVRLFNDAAAERLSRAAGLDDPADTEPSAVTESRLIDYGLDVIDRYNQAKNQCNALIQWHEKTRNERDK